MQIVFETPRLFLRLFTKDDAALILALNSDPEIVKYVHENILKTEAEAKNIISNIILPQYKNNLGRWAIHLKSDGAFIGWCGLKHLPDSSEIDLGYRLMKPAWGKGYATEAARHTLEHGFKKLDLPLITGKAHIDN
ncbi:MAG: GNAT family N-acetyltransferase, partial [Chitinophagaceae bacterium]|nr:GNAT family N-acetyltransferase [Chitinophagaceae bacterium]